MKKILLAASAVALALSAGAAFAADLPSRKEAPIYVPPPPPPLWTGFYAGLNIGGGWDDGAGSSGYSAYYDPRYAIGSKPTTGGGGCGNGWGGNNWGGNNRGNNGWGNNGCGGNNWGGNNKGNNGGGKGGKSSSIANLFLDPNGNSLGTAGGVLGGAQIGYNYEFGQFLIGVETDFQGTSISSSGNNNPVPLIASPYAGGAYLTPVGALAGSGPSLEWFGTVRGRVGYLILPTLLVYGTGGFAYGQIDAFGFSNTDTGWTAGGGVEWMFAPNWSAKAEYLYISLSNNNWNGGGGFNFGNAYNPQFNVVRAGINYHFNWGAAAPVVAKY